MNSRFLTCWIGLVMVGCAPTSIATQQASLDAIASGLTAADILALQYTSLPACPATAPCADPTIKGEIKTAALTAADAVAAAQAAIAAGQTVDLTTVSAALAALQTLLAANAIKAAQ